MKKIICWLVTVYTKELPRIVREQFRLTFLLLLLGFIGVVISYRLYPASTSVAISPNLAQCSAIKQLYGLSARLPREAWQGSWLYYAVPNSLNILLNFVLSIPFLGAQSLFAAWDGGVRTGYTIAQYLPKAQAAAGSGALGTAAALLLPHALFEIPAAYFSSALGLRAGLAWLLPLPGRNRRRSVWRLTQDYLLAFCCIILPLLVLSSFLEMYVRPKFWERHLLGIGTYPKVAEHSINRLPYTTAATLSPDARYLAEIGSGKELWLRRITDGTYIGPPVTFGQVLLAAPSFSPDSQRVAVIGRPAAVEPADQLLVFNRLSQHTSAIPGGPAGRYITAAWAPQGDRVAVAIVQPAAGRHPANVNLWLVDVATYTWRQATHFLPPRRISDHGGVAWKSDGSKLAFVGYLTSAQGDNMPTCAIWTISPSGAGLQQIASGDDFCAVSWSHDGRWLAYLANRPGLNPSDKYPMAELGLIHPDGSGRIGGLARADMSSNLYWRDNDTELNYIRVGTLISGAPYHQR